MKSNPAIRSFLGSPFDGHTVDPLPHQMEINKTNLPKEPACDRGGKGKPEIRGVKIIMPSPSEETGSAYRKQVKRKKCRAGAAIEPITGHLKTGFRMQQNYLRGEKGIQINALMAVIVCNLKKWMEEWKEKFL